MVVADLVHADDAYESMMKHAKTILREPIVHFLLLGLLLFGAAGLYARWSDPQRIVVDDKVVARLGNQYAQQFGAPPPPAKLAYLVEDYIRDEALYREGIANGLDRNDEVVRRRVVQKMEFLADRDDEISTPSLAQLKAYYDKNGARYLRPVRVTFTHVYFSPDAGGDNAARDRAARMMGELKANPSRSAETLGDPFPGQQHFALVANEDVERVFGRSEFSTRLAKLPQDTWSGPVRSGYGWHLIRIDNREAGRQLPFADVQDTVRADWLEEQRVRRKDEAFSKLLRRYLVIREDRPGGKKG